MERSEVLNVLLGTTVEKRYLEIGVQQGLTFHAIRAERLVAVDPQFLFDHPVPTTGNAQYHEMTSDRYFGSIIRADDLFDVIFIDGLHTFDQTLRDLLNSIDHLAPHGRIVIDDVLPSTYPASLPSHADMAAAAAASGETSPAWMGDVYRLVFFIRHYLPAFSYATVAENHGQTILWHARRDLPVDTMSIEEIARASFADSLLRREQFSILPFAQILKLIGQR